MTLFSTIQAVTLRTQVADQIRLAIIEGRLRPGDHITELALTKQLGVSRTPVREALILLESEGLVVFAPNRGYDVRTFTEKTVLEIFSMRTTLENMAAEINTGSLHDDEFERLYALIDEQTEALQRGAQKDIRRIDVSFHHLLIERTGHELLIRNWTGIVAQIAALLNLRAEAFPDYDETQAIQDHQAILRAYQSGSASVVMEVNRRINDRVAHNCAESIRVQRVTGV